MINESIQKSRRGIAYQDRYALLKFLEYFQRGRLKEFYTDYPFGEEGNSLDIFIVLTNPVEEHIFEIKTGKKFKTDKRKKLSKELHTLYKFSQKNSRTSKFFLAINPEISAEILRSWSDLQTIAKKQAGTWGNETYNQIVQRCQKDFDFREIIESDFISFIKSIEFEQGIPNNLENEKTSPLENVIIGRIQNICEKVKSSGANIEIPYWTTMLELLEAVRKGAEHREDILSSIIEILSDSFARRHFIEEKIQKLPGVSRPDSIDQQKKLIEKRLKTEYQKTTIDTKNKDFTLQQINQIVQSKEYLKNKNTILDFLKDEDLKFYFLGKLPKKSEDLGKMEFLLEKIIKDERPFNLFKILKESISDKNNGFIINFLQKHYKELEEKPDDLFQRESLRIVKKIIEQYPDTVDSAFTSVKQVLTLRGKEYEEFGSKQKYDTERKLIAELLEKVFSVYKKQNDKNKIKEIIKSIDKHFNLVGDDKEFVMYTPNSIFKILKDYVDIDFEKNFKEISKIFVNQYSQEWKKYGGKTIYDGWELMGGATSFSGYNYKVSDRNFILYTLKPSMENYYKKNKEKTWHFMVNNCIRKTEKVSRNYPDFLNRVSVSVLLNRYKSENKKVSQEAFKILEEFILSRKGIPHKSELIYQELCSGFSDDKKWQLIKVSIDKYKIPLNPFVEQITLELAKKGQEKAKKILINWVKNPDYYQRGGFFERNVVVNISQFLDISLNEGVEMFKDFINGNYFLKKMESFDVFNVAGVLNKIINKDVEIGLKILKSISQKPKLTDNEQILLYSSLTGKSNVEGEDEKVLIKIYKEFLNPFLNNLDNDIKKIERKITRSQSRGEIVEFADTLAKHKKIPEAMRIARIFINDSDPCTPEKKDPEDSEGKYDGHKRIEQGEDMNTVTAVRGRCAWTLMNCSVLAGRDYIEETINLVEKLTKDKNYYVQLMSCYSLSQLARNRLTVIQDNREELFLNKNKEKALKMAKRVEKISFNLLEKFSQLDSKPRDVLMKALLRAFDHIRALNQKEALKLMKKIAECGEKVIAEASSLFIYYAEIRKMKHDFKDWKLKMTGLYDDLENFDEKVFQKLLKDVLKKRNPEVNSQFAWQFWKLTKQSVPDKADVEKTIEYSEAFEISIEYLNILANNYNHRTFANIYYFIQENIDKRFEDCYKLWRKCLRKEKSTIKEFIKKGKTYEIGWWPFDYNGEILMVIKQKGGNEKFLSSLEFLSGYPKEAIIGEINEAVKTLQNLPTKYNQQVEKIFNKLIVRNPNFYDKKKMWEKIRKS